MLKLAGQDGRSPVDEPSGGSPRNILLIFKALQLVDQACSWQWE